MTGTYPRGAFSALREQVRTLEVATYTEGHEFNLAEERVKLCAWQEARFPPKCFPSSAAGRNWAGLSCQSLPGNDNLVVLSNQLWEQRFGRDPGIVGRSIELEGVNRPVLGVMPAEFRFPSTKTLFWIPLHVDPRENATYWRGDYMPVIGRLRPGFRLHQASAEIRLFQSRVGALFPWRMPAAWNADIDVVPLKNDMVSDVRARLLMLLAAVALVLLMHAPTSRILPCRAQRHGQKSWAFVPRWVRNADASSASSSTESLLLACLGGGLGLGMAAAGLRLFKAFFRQARPVLPKCTWTGAYFCFPAGSHCSLASSSELRPPLQTSRSAITQSVNSSERGSSTSVSQRLRNSLAVAEVAFAVLLVTAAGLLIRSFWALSHVKTGFQAEHVLTARITPNESFCSDTARCLSFYRSVLDKVQHEPGVNGAALVNTLPLNGRVAKRAVGIEGLSLPAGESSRSSG